MDSLTKEEALLQKNKLFDEIKEGAIFLYPTDTIYGIGCSALDSEAVNKVRQIKKRPEMPFSVLVPSKQWIYDNCVVNERAKMWIEKLPGAYTLIIELKNKEAIVPEVNNDLATVGVRIPKHWCSDFVNKLGFPILTTSANVQGGNFMTEEKDLNPRIKSSMNFMIYEGPKKGRPSMLVDLTKRATKLTKR